MDVINNAQARAYAEGKVWKNHAKSNDILFANKAKIKSDTQLCNLLQIHNGMIPEMAKLSHAKKDLSEIEKREGEILRQIEERLAQHQLSMEDIEFAPRCKKCGDTGKIGSVDCECFSAYMFEYIAQRMNSEKAEIGFENAQKFAKSNGELGKFYDYAEKFCKRFPDVSKRVIMMIGTVGSGKTHLAKVMLEELLAKGASGLFLSAFAVEDVFLKHFYNSTSFNPKQIINDEYDMLSRVDVLVCDDLGTEILHNKHMSAYFLNLLDTRQQRRKLTIFTTNLTPEKISEKYGERFFSRLKSSSTVVLKMVGKELRSTAK